MFSGDTMGLRELVKALRVRLAGLPRPLFRKEYAVLEPPPVPQPQPPLPPLVLWETWEGVPDEVLEEALEAIRQDVEEQIQEGQDMFRGLN